MILDTVTFENHTKPQNWS